MSAHFTDISVSARFSELPGLLATIAQRATELGIPADVALRLQLVVEELFTNTVSHGYQGGSENRVRLALGRHDDVVTLRYADEAPAFELMEIAEKTASTVALGGLGITLIRGLCKSVRHQRRDGRNVTEIEL